MACRAETALCVEYARVARLPPLVFGLRNRQVEGFSAAESAPNTVVVVLSRIV